MGIWALAATVMFGAAFLRGLTGFGSSLIAVPVLALLYGPVEAVAILVLLETVASAYLFPQAYRATRWRLVAVLVAASVPGIVLGTLALTALQPALLKLFIGATSIAFALLLLGGSGLPVQQWPWVWPLAGLVGGFFQGSTAMGGPPLIILLTSRFADKAVLRSTFITLFGALFVITISTFAVRGLLGAGSATLALSLLPLWMGGLWLGTRLFHRVPSALFRKIALVAIVLASAPAVVAGAVDLVGRR